MITAKKAIADLDAALKRAGEDIVLRRRVGEGEAATYVSVTCRARVDGIDNTQAPAGIRLSEFGVILSPTQITQSGWPAGAIDDVIPPGADPRIPRENDTDDVMLRGQAYVIVFCDPKFVAGELVRINLRAVA